jgi:hypothetical protein
MYLNVAPDVASSIQRSIDDSQAITDLLVLKKKGDQQVARSNSGESGEAGRKEDRGIGLTTRLGWQRRRVN